MAREVAPHVLKLRRIRENVGLSQEAVAAECGYTRTLVSVVEMGLTPMSLEMLRRFCRTLDRPELFWELGIELLAWKCAEQVSRRTDLSTGEVAAWVMEAFEPHRERLAAELQRIYREEEEAADGA